jgi:steroid 5-alpha reductase family enzyme
MIEIVSAIAGVSALMLLFFCVAQYIRNNSIADIAWGIGFALIAASLLVARGTYTDLQLLVVTLVLIWASRLSTHIALRQMGRGEDPRYTAWRASWGKQQALGAFLSVFLLQSILMFVVSAPVIAVQLGALESIGILAKLGTLVWIIGFACEVIADAQLAAFLQKAENRGQLMTNGLWRYSRHPNYFGEILIWWGIYIIALSVPYGWLSIVGPATITYLLRYVSGVPLAERSLESHPEFAQYKKTTSILIIWPPKE